MSFKGAVAARCPGGCEPAELEVWSFVRGDADPSLRDQFLAGDLNLVLCEECGRAYYPESTVVYYDPGNELLAFVFPESYAKDKEKWRVKMLADYAEMRAVLALAPSAGAPPRGKAGFRAEVEPIMVFGLEEARALLQAEDDLEDEAMVAAHLCRELGLSLFPVDRAYARARRLPPMLPFEPEGKQRAFSPAGARAGLKRLVGKNDRLEGFARWLAEFEGGAAPPQSKTGKVAHPS